MHTRLVATILGVCALVVLAALVAPETSERARAFISGAARGAVEIAAPSSVLEGSALESDTTVWAFDEEQVVTLSGPLGVNVLNSADPGAPLPSDCTKWNAGLTENGSIPGGRQVSSHLLHADKVGNDSTTVNYDGPDGDGVRVSFNRQIIGVMFMHDQLHGSNGSMGAPGTDYEPSLSASPDFELTTPRDYVQINCSAPRTVDVVLHVNSDVDQLRVITDENDAPNCGAAKVPTNEDAPVSFSLPCSDPESNPITCSVVAPLPSKGTLNIAACSSVTYKPFANANGSDTVTYTATDQFGASTTATVKVNINPVNDVPSFVKGSNQGVLEDAGAQTVAGWATSLSPGKANEAGQALDFIGLVSNDNNALFSVQPAVAPDGTLTYTPAPNANGGATVTVQIHDDGGTAKGGVNTSAAQTFTIAVKAVNDAPSFNRGPDQTVLEDSGAQTVFPWATSLSPGKHVNEAGQALDFIGLVSNDNNALFSVQPAVAPDGTLTYTPALNANGSATVTVQLHDNGGTVNGGVDKSAPQTFTITVTPVNDVPICGATSVSINEDKTSGSFPLPCTELDGEPLTCLVVAPPASKGTLNILTCSSVTYTPNQNANGSDTVTYTASDPFGKFATATVTVTITPRNDVPIFFKGPDQKVLENAGPQTVFPWATAISPGKANETEQALDFIVSNDNTALFSVQPAVAADGTLTYTPATKAFGVASVTVQLHDDGGTAGGGVNTSPPQAFTITVNQDLTLDSDGDGCTDARELQTAPGSEQTGGRRNPNSFWDFYDVWTRESPTSPWVRDKAVTSTGDMNAMTVSGRFGSERPGGAPSKAVALAEALTPPTSDTGYHAIYDRGMRIGPNPWDVAGPDGYINVVDDMVAMASQGFHSCE